MHRNAYFDTKSPPPYTQRCKIHSHTHIYSHNPRNGVTTSVDTVTHCLMSHSPESIADILPLPVCMSVCVCLWALLLKLWQSSASLGRDVCLSVCSVKVSPKQALHSHRHTLCHHGHRHKNSDACRMTVTELFLLP